MIRNIAYLFTIIALTTGYAFKFMHKAGAGLILITALIAMIILLIEYIIRQAKTNFFSRKTLIGTLGIIYVLGVLFKLLHYKGADIMFVTSISGLSIAFLEYAYRSKKSIYAILPLLFAITLVFILFKILHWPRPPYILYGSYFAFSALVPLLLLKKGLQLKPTHNKLSNHFLIIGSLSFTLLIFEIINKGTQMGTIDWIPLSNIMIIVMLLFAALVLTITKTLQIQQLKEKFKNDFQILNCLKGIYLIILVLFVLIKA